MHSTSRSSPHFGAARSTGDRRPCTSRSHYSEAERASASRPRYSGRDNQPCRTQPGEELVSPCYNSWMDQPDEPLPTFMPMSSRSTPPQQTVHSPRRRRSGEQTESRCHSGNVDSSARGYSQKSAGSKPLPAKGQVRPDSAGPKLRPEKDQIRSRRNSAYGLGPHPWSMGSSVATSAQGSVIDSCPSDLWETASVDSLPLGAEWFNFMHGRK